MAWLPGHLDKGFDAAASAKPPLRWEDLRSYERLRQMCWSAPSGFGAFEWVSMSLKRGEMMMAGETQKNTRAATGNMGTQPDSGTENDVSRGSQTDEQQPDEAAVWKEKYARLFADLENTKKRLARSSAQEVEMEKEALLRDVLPVADGLDLAVMHTSSEEDNRSILQGIELVRNILNKFFIKYDVIAIDAWGKPIILKFILSTGQQPVWQGFPKSLSTSASVKSWSNPVSCFTVRRACALRMFAN